VRVLRLLCCRFRSFVTWRDTLSHVLLATLAQSVKEGWSQDALQPQRQQPVAAACWGPQQQQQLLQQQGSGGGTAQQLMAR
jgi:RecA-family ATPase